MSSVDFKIEKDLCRCCHSQGIYKSLSDPCPRSKEAFSDMLRFCFEINLTPIPGMRCITTYKICSACIKRLQDAVEFKNSVLACEDLFRDMYAKSVKEEDSDVMVIKEESSGEDVAIILDDSDVLSVKDEEDPSSLNNVTTVAVELAGSEAEVKTEDEDGGITDDDFRIDDATSGTDEDFKKQLKEYQRKATSRRRAKTVKEQANMSKKRKKDKPTGRKEKGGAEPQKEKKSATKGAVAQFRVNPDDFKKVGNAYQCTRCNKTYSQSDSLRGHLKAEHYAIPAFQCSLCSEGFKTETAWTVHKLEKHNIDDRIHCNACKGAFNTKAQLRRHRNVFHMLGKRHKCDVCEFETFKVCSLYKHKYKHKTVKDYQCKFCKKSFLRKSNLGLHERIHTGDRRSVCKVCGQAFVQKASLNYHMVKHHPEIRF